MKRGWSWVLCAALLALAGCAELEGEDGADGAPGDPLAFPDGTAGEVIAEPLSGGYTVPAGMTLYIARAYSDSGAGTEIRIEGDVYAGLNVTILTFLYNLPVRGGSELTTTQVETWIQGLLVEEGVTILNRNLAEGYTVPDGQRLYLLTADGADAVTQTINIDGVPANENTGTYQTFAPPFIVDGGQEVAASADDLFATGYLLEQ